MGSILRRRQQGNEHQQHYDRQVLHSNQGVDMLALRVRTEHPTHTMMSVLGKRWLSGLADPVSRKEVSILLISCLLWRCSTGAI